MDLDDNESRGVFGAHSSNPAMSIIGAEDEFFESDLNDCKYFGSIDQLKDHPAHLLTFIQHVILQFDPAPLLCYLHGALHKNLSAKETKKQFVEFHNNFLDKGAVLRVAVPLSISNELDRNRPELLPEETQKRFVHDVQSLQTGEVAKQLDDFRQKRMMGMTPCEAELMDVENHYPTDRIPMEMKEKSVAENILDKMAEPTIVSDEEKCQSIFSAVALYMKHLGVKTRAVDSKKSRGGFFRIPIGKVHLPLSWEMYGSLTVLNSASSMVTNIISVLASEIRKVARSESARVDRHSSRRRGSSRAKQSRSRSDVDLQPPFTTSSSPAPLNGPGASPTSASPQLEEVEPRLLEFEQDPPNWRELAAPEAVSSLRKKEIKRQEVINELFATEHAHVRMLSVLQMIFAKPLERAALLTADELAAIFPNLDEIIDMHYNFYENLKKLRHEDGFIVKSISTTVLNRFGGTEGEWFQKLTARSCSHQSWALEQIKSRQKKDPRFNSFIQEAESKPQCRRLQLKDIIPTEMQRLTKYPLLLENIAKNTEDFKEKERIQQSAECCRKILNHVNEEVKSMENLLTLKEYQRKLDTSGLKPSNELYTEYKNIDLTQKKMLFEGSLTWKVTKEKAIEVQCVLLGDMLVLLQKLDDKMVLKCQSKSSIAVEGKMMLSPIIKLDSVFLREVATDQKAFYVIFTWESGAQIYELVAQTVGERKWEKVCLACQTTCLFIDISKTYSLGASVISTISRWA
uniref:Rho guanine nucleotide exchange factor (GEF) 1b n=1 Tax=Neogobius melanostomus TaxID=47308 RepID=A0A8C6TFG1_9GOBI